MAAIQQSFSLRVRKESVSFSSAVSLSLMAQRTWQTFRVCKGWLSFGGGWHCERMSLTIHVVVLILAYTCLKDSRNEHICRPCSHGKTSFLDFVPSELMIDFSVGFLLEFGWFHQGQMGSHCASLDASQAKGCGFGTVQNVVVSMLVSKSTFPIG